jgi:uncharacterized protein (DUF885 family)
MTPVFDLADAIVESTAANDPVAATFMGVAGYADRLTDYGPAAADERASQQRRWLSDLDALPTESDDDLLAASVVRDRIGTRLALHESGEHLRDVNVLASPVQFLQQVFTLMPTADDAQWSDVAARLEAIPAALDSMRAAYREGITAGLLPARRQVLGAARTAAIAAGLEAEGDGAPEPWFVGLVAGYGGGDPRLQSRLNQGAESATAAYAALAGWLRDTYAPAATEQDAVGAARYRILARAYTGAVLDLEETYAWGWEDLGRITERMRHCSAQLYGGVTPEVAAARLNEDPDHTIEGAEATRAWLQQVTDDTISSFDGRYFDIPEQMRVCEAMIAPPGGAAAPYYTPPSEDFSRPGRTWLPAAGQTRFRAWWLLSVWYHEAVPGHHLQIAYTVLQRERLSRFQRVEMVSGHAEGWALYAERLMDELGYFDTPAVELGYLSAQAMRAVRAIHAIGLHHDLPGPGGVDPARREAVPGLAPGSRWDRDTARQFLSVRGLLPDYFAASEVDRYLGLPGQAISYKVGERAWLAARDAARSAAGDTFDLKAWHMRALALGSVGLDLLGELLADR